MKTDPRAACANTNERTGWAFVHDLIAHPLMALSAWSGWALRFHDRTSMKAWPRDLPAKLTTTKFYVERLGEIRVTHLRDGLFLVKHPFWLHDFVTKADTAVEARDIGVVWFESLDDLTPNPTMKPSLKCRHNEMVRSIPKDMNGNLFECEVCHMRTARPADGVWN